MDIGKLDRRIRIETPTITKDAHGAPSVTWTTVTSCWANVQEVLPSKKGAESLVHDARMAQRSARVRTRYIPGITSDMRVIYVDRANRVMQLISQPVEMGRAVGLEFMVADFSTAGT